MTSKRVTIGFLFLVLAVAGGPVTCAQDDLPPSLVPSLDQANLLQDQSFAAGAMKGQAECGAGCSPCPCFYGYAEALFLERTNCSSNQPVIVNQALDPVLSTSDVNFGFDPAVRILLGHRLCNGWALEGSYLGLFDSDASAFAARQEGGFPLRFPDDGMTGNVFGNIDQGWVDYSSALHSGELNFVCCCGCCWGGCTTGNPCANDCTAKSDCAGGYTQCRTLEWILGVRYLNLGERFRIYAQAYPDPAVPSVYDDGWYDIRTSNNLIGPQVGARLRRWGPRWGWEATGKAGVFGNYARQKQYVIDYADPDYFYLREPTSDTGGQVAFVGELNLSAIYRLNDVWNLRGGYNLLCLTGVALAPDQLDFSGTVPSGNQLHSGGSVLLHGVSLGIEARW